MHFPVPFVDGGGCHLLLLVSQAPLRFNFIGIPSAIMEVAQAAIDSIILPSGATEWSFESSSSTDKGDGQEPYVISGKRRSWYEYAISNNEDDIEDLTTSMITIETDVTSLTARVAVIEQVYLLCILVF